MTPFIDLRHIAIDPALVHYLPPGLARYYEALPVAREGERVTVAMSHPENVTALAVLTQLFHADIVPIRTDGAAVRAALQELYAREATQPNGVLAWLPAATQPAWAARLRDYGLVDEGTPLTLLDADTVDADALLAAARGGNYQLTLCALSAINAALQSDLLREIHAPLWLVPAQPTPPRRILLVLRGFASDEVAIRWVTRLAHQQPTVEIKGDGGNPSGASAHQPPTSVALLPIMGQGPWGALRYLQQGGNAQAHVGACAAQLAEADIQPTLTLQSGEPRQQVAQAVRQGGYDLMVVAAEGHGHFVGQLLADLEEKCTLPLGGVLVLKPSHEHAQRRS
jgi:nucleotide-binding universal stress UspA family protein